MDTLATSFSTTSKSFTTSFCLHRRPIRSFRSFQIYKDFTHAYYSWFRDGRRTISNRMLFADEGSTSLLNRAWDGFGCKDCLVNVTQVFSAIDNLLAEVARLRHSDPEQIAMMLGMDARLSLQHVVGLVMIHIDERCGRDGNLNAVSRFSGYSAAHINRIFQSNLGCSITEHANA